MPPLVVCPLTQEVGSDRVVVSRSGAIQEIRMPAKPPPDGIVKVR